MTAIITQSLKSQLLRTIFDENEGVLPGDSNNNYYIAIGRSQQWQAEDNTDLVPDPASTEREERLFRYNMQSVKAAEGYSYVVPLYDWTANTQYQAFNDNVSGHPAQSYYVRTADNNVYMCLRTGKNDNGVTQVSTVKPDHTTTALPIETDGYVWKYLYTISTPDANRFLTTAFMPLKYVDSDTAVADPTQASQWLVAQAAQPGQVLGYRVTEGGGPYTSPPAITIRGNGTGATARAILSSTGSIAAIEVDDSDGSGNKASDTPYASNTYLIGRNDGTSPDGGYGFGKNYDYADVTISSSSLSAGGTAAKAVPIFGPKAGLGADVRDDLRALSFMFNIKPEGTVSDKWVIDQGYRQIGILRNPLDSAQGNLFTGTQGIGLNRMTLTTPAGDGNVSNGYAISFDQDTLITGGTSSAQAWLDYYDDSSTIWYHQDETTGFGTFQDGENVTVEGYSASTLTLDSANVAPDFDVYSGDLLFINNFTEVTRDPDQTEDIKVVIKL